MQRHEPAGGTVVLDDRLRLGVVDRETALHRLGRVVGAVLLDSAAAHPLAGVVVAEIEEQDRVENAVDLREHRVERPRLRQVAREAVEDEALHGVVLGESLPDHLNRDVVGDELPARHDLEHLAAERRRPVERAEHVARRDVRQAVVGRDPLRLRALAGALRPEQQEIHYFKKPS